MECEWNLDKYYKVLQLLWDFRREPASVHNHKLHGSPDEAYGHNINEKLQKNCVIIWLF